MKTLSIFGDSYANLSVSALDALSQAEGFDLNVALVDPSLEPFDWLWENQERIYNAINIMPADTVMYWSTGGIDALNYRPMWQMRSMLNQLIELMDYRGFPIYHFGYEWWPPVSGVDERMEPLYSACKSLDCKHSLYHFVDMRGAIPFNEVEYVDMLHLSQANYQRRVDHAWATQLRYVL